MYFLGKAPVWGPVFPHPFFISISQSSLGVYVIHMACIHKVMQANQVLLPGKPLYPQSEMRRIPNRSNTIPLTYTGNKFTLFICLTSCKILSD